MPSRPPETPFYERPSCYQLWRDVSRLYEDFIGSEEDLRKGEFVHVLQDVLNYLDPLKCNNCQVPVINVAANGVDLRCPRCNWTPVEVMAMSA